MDELISDADDIDFYIETQLEEQIGLQPLPYPGMDKSGSGVCNFYIRGNCHLGGTCPFRHIKADRSIVCKHWLRGLCKKGDDCEFLHEFDMSKMPECYFFTKFGQCLNKECPFLHIDPNSKLKECEWYDRGFCRNGPNCKNKHVRRIACVNYLNGFCIDGPVCRFAHPKWQLPGIDNMQERKQSWVCHNCGERGHKIQFCFKLTDEARKQIQDQLVKKNEILHQQQMQRNNLFPYQPRPPLSADMSGDQSMAQSGSANISVTSTTDNMIPDLPAGIPRSFPYQPGQGQMNQRFRRPYQRGGGQYHQRQPRMRNPNEGPNDGGPKPLSEVTCFKCGDKGHYANQCPKGHLAFLSKADQEELQQTQKPDSDELHLLPL